MEEGTSVKIVCLLDCLFDVLSPCTVLVESHSKVLCCVSHLQYMPVDVESVLVPFLVRKEGTYLFDQTTIQYIFLKMQWSGDCR